MTGSVLLCMILVFPHWILRLVGVEVVLSCLTQHLDLHMGQQCKIVGKIQIILLSVDSQFVLVLLRGLPFSKPSFAQDANIKTAPLKSKLAAAIFRVTFVVDS